MKNSTLPQIYNLNGTLKLNTVIVKPKQQMFPTENWPPLLIGFATGSKQLIGRWFQNSSFFAGFLNTPSWKKILDENWSTELYHTSFFLIFHVELEYVIFEMIHWANLKGKQF